MIRHHRLIRLGISICLWLLLVPVVFAQDTATEFGEYSIDGRIVSITLPADKQIVSIPNLHAPMMGNLSSDSDEPEDQKYSITPMVDAWQIKAKQPPKTDKQIQLRLGSKPILANQLKPIRQRPDGGFDFPAHLARVVGKKLRYELQPWKNTVGYWVEPEDYAYFVLRCDRPSEWNVGILQGCGAGQGGSDVTVSLLGPIGKPQSKFKSDQEPATGNVTSHLSFVVEETGHFQNFKWRHIGQLSTARKGVYVLKVATTKIAKNAVMDFRAISMTPIPEE